jgi:hypothetical protein
MAALSNTTSALITGQLPEFIVENYPNFVQFLTAYYKWMESQPLQTANANNGGVIYNTKNLLNYRDLDNNSGAFYNYYTQEDDDFLNYFTNDFLPYFPNSIALDKTKLIKAAKNFYNRKGSYESVQFLFRVLYDEEINIYYPKNNILKASDGKWNIPQAVKVIIGGTDSASVNIGPTFDVSLLNRAQARGTKSNTICAIESAALTVDAGINQVVVEIYISNLTKAFVAGENLVVTGSYANTMPWTFSEQIIGELSNLKINPKNRGLNYNGATFSTVTGKYTYSGDPVVFIGGLARSAVSEKAIAFVNNATSGQITAVSPYNGQGGFGYTLYPNTHIDVISSTGTGANVIVTGLSQQSNIAINIDSVYYKRNASIGGYGSNIANVVGQTSSSVNIYGTGVSTVEGLYNGSFVNFDGGTGSGQIKEIITYDSVTNIVTLNSALSILPDTTTTFNITMYGTSPVGYATYGFANQFFHGTVSTTGTTSSLINLGSTSSTTQNYYGNTLLIITSGTASGQARQILRYSATNYIATMNSAFSVTPDDTSNWFVTAFANTPLGSAFSYSNISIGSISTLSVINGGSGFKSKPTYDALPYYDTDYSSDEFGTETYVTVTQPLSNFGLVANVTIISGGTNYQVNDKINLITGVGYGADIEVASISPSGGITGININAGGEGYPHPLANVPLTVTSTSGAGAILVAYGYGEGANLDSSVSHIGEIQDFRIVSRGFDYITTPNVSLRIVDVSITNVLSDSQILTISDDQTVYQGVSPTNSTFLAYIDKYNSELRNPPYFVRLYNYSGAIDTQLPLTIVSSAGNLNVSPNLLSPQTLTVYGNGLARANVSFLNGLIQYNGFYLNTDGQLSSDQYLQANTKYHNYAYVIQSEHSLNEYQNALMQIAHPAGMQMLNDMMIVDTIPSEVTPTENLSRIYSWTGSVTANAADPNGNLTGSGTNFVTSANVGDLIIIDSTDSIRQQTKVIKQIISDTLLVMESNTRIMGNGMILMEPSSNVINVTANIYGSVSINDNVSFEFDSNIYTGANVVYLDSSPSMSNIKISTASASIAGDDYVIDGFSMIQGSNTIITSNSSASIYLAYGMHIYGQYIPNGTYIESISYTTSGTKLYLSQTLENTASNVSLSFNNSGIYYILPVLTAVSYQIINTNY